mmetsp:Transcript_6457/g.29123  ORF Transcript_6457/g.29123 Transcript_6457/m.29123 type:complete len:201 (-) Transcript_6457:602-1204(-)
MLGFAGEMSRHRTLDPTVRPPSSSRTARPSLTLSNAVSQCWPTRACLYNTRTGCRSPGCNTPRFGDTSTMPCSTTNRWCAVISSSGSPISTQFSMSTSDSSRVISRHSAGSAPVLQTSTYAAVGSAPSNPTPRPSATEVRPWRDLADARDPSYPPVRCSLSSTAVGGRASSALRALSDSLFHKTGLATPGHAASVTQSVG